MNKHLFKYEIKSNYKLFIIFLLILTMYITIIHSMYNPEMGSVLNDMAKSMPQFFALFGMLNVGTSLIDFYISYLYGFILIVIPAIFSVIVSFKLIAKPVASGTMALFLNTGLSRRKIIVNQMTILIISNIIMIAYVAFLMLFLNKVSYPSEPQYTLILKINGYLLLLQLCLSAIVFLLSSTFNELKHSLGLPSLAVFIFVLIKMLSEVSKNTKVLRYINPLSLFNPQLVVDGNVVFINYCILLGSLALLLFGLSISVFEKKNLYL